jgi:hypothetical protein
MPSIIDARILVQSKPTNVVVQQVTIVAMRPKYVEEETAGLRDASLAQRGNICG